MAASTESVARAPSMQAGQPTEERASEAPEKGSKGNGKARPKAGNLKPKASGKKTAGKSAPRKKELPSVNDPLLGNGFWESIPVVEERFTLRTQYMQHAFRRVRRTLAVNAYLAEAFPAAHGWAHWSDITDAIEALLDRKFDEAETVVAESERNAEKMMTLLGISETPKYSDEKQLIYGRTTPRVARFVRLMERIDTQIGRMEALWLAEGGISQKECRNEVIRLRQIPVKLAGYINRLADRIRAVNRRQTTEEEAVSLIAADCARVLSDAVESSPNR